MGDSVRCSVSEFVALANQTLEFAYPTIEVEGEVASFKVNQGKFIFFDLKDDESSIGCFMTVWQLRIPIEDGMKVIVTGSPKLTKWGKFSLTVRAVRPTGEGSIKKSFELLKTKLDKEGLFAAERKRPLPPVPSRIAVISSTQAAGYIDFIKILGERWGDVTVETAHVQVQGSVAPQQIIRALRYFNQQEILPEIIVIVRGGGSADDLAAFNDEPLVREITASRVPVLTGIGHEIDISLVDLVADRAASTPSNAAEIIVPARTAVAIQVQQRLQGLAPRIEQTITYKREYIEARQKDAVAVIEQRFAEAVRHLEATRQFLRQCDPRAILERGYAMLRGEVAPGAEISIETHQQYITAEVRNVSSK